ncbi:MAG: hypothetical protein ACLR8L_16290, partial [Oscillospiraceae bacterium]
MKDRPWRSLPLRGRKISIFFKSNKCEMFNILISDELWNQAAAFIGPSPVLRDLTGAEPIKINLHQEDFQLPVICWRPISLYHIIIRTTITRSSSCADRRTQAVFHLSSRERQKAPAVDGQSAQADAESCT